MELRLENGRYLPSGTGVCTVDGARELCQRVTMKLCARRGKFWPLPGYGSRLYTLLQGVRPELRESAVREFAAEALAYELGLTLEDVSMELQGDCLLLRLYFKYYGGTFKVETAIGEDV
mgnify:CR=1 FL=1